MTTHSSPRVRRRWPRRPVALALVVVLGTVGLTSADVVGTAGRADAYWAAAGRLTSATVSAGALMPNLTCTDSGVNSGTDSNGVHNIRLAWDRPAPAGTTYAVTIQVRDDGGYTMAAKDWAVEGSGTSPCTGSDTPCTNASTIYSYGPNDLDDTTWPSRTTTLTMNGLTQTQFGINVGYVSTRRTFTGTVQITATLPGTSWTVTSQTFAWSVTQPSSNDGTGVVTCTPSAPNIDIAVGPNEAGVTLAGDSGTWVYDAWTFANALPGESIARSFAVKNVGTVPALVSATMLEPAPNLGFTAAVWTTAGAAAPAVNGTRQQQASAAVANVGSYTLRTGTCSGGTQTRTDSALTTTATSAFGATTLAVGQVITVCVVLTLPATTTTAPGTAGAPITVTVNAVPVS